MDTAEPPAFLAAGIAWEASIDADTRKRRGQWLTPWWAVERLTALACAGLPDRPVILDPACGDGRWLVAAARACPGARLLGWDIDPGAIAAARQVCAAAGVDAELSVRDTLRGEEREVADLVLGNPPYVRVQRLELEDRAYIFARYRCATDKSDLYAPFMERMLELSRGRLAIVVADSWLSMSSFAALRERVWSAGGVQIASLPAASFGADVSTVALRVEPGLSPRRGVMDEQGWRDLGPLSRTGGLIPLAEAPDLPGVGILGDRFRLRMGIVCGSYEEWVHKGHRGPLDQPTCRGRDVRRWSIADRGELVRYDPRAMLEARPYVAPKHAGLFDQPAKLVLSGASGATLRAAVDELRRFPLDSCYVSEGEGDVWALCGLLNSAPVNAWYSARFPAIRVKAVELHGLPWPPGRLSRLAEAARAADQAGVDSAARQAYRL